MQVLSNAELLEVVREWRNCESEGELFIPQSKSVAERLEVMWTICCQWYFGCIQQDVSEDLFSDIS